MAAKKQQQKIEFTIREKTGTGVCRKIRAKNLIPVILYGPEYKQGLAGTVSARAIAPIANSEARETTVIELGMSDGKECMALIRDVQRHLLTQNIRHIDFYQVLKGHKIKVEIPIRVINKELSPGIKEGGLLNQITRSLSVEIKPRDIPEDIVVDIAELMIGGEIFIKDLTLPEDCDLLTAEDTLVLHISQPRAVSETEGDLLEEGSAEVEVVAKGKAKEGDEE
ncbi:MAG: 50S ribosomal protein L25 [Synergistaceae bacterium]|jgi:large subunit ribosomal protein L25|nr:50S ribosomal protein L25 [Synergistaceae bacterium]MBP9560000.1 50S ribosomal protein L25 [Synergistaceae bacterium]MBP9974850.1 50S ribosomal protein L25 [Synergistaceae bacterium]MDD4837721.1 50S ribosomal protein L25 [Synergistaceae bacterium]